MGALSGCRETRQLSVARRPLLGWDSLPSHSEGVIAMDFRTLVIAVVEARAQEAAEKEALRAASDRTAEAEQALMDAMESEGIKTLNIPEVGMATVKKPRLYARYDVADLEKAMDWLKAAGHGEAIKPTVHNATFSAIVGEALDSGAQLPEFVKVSYVPTLSIREAQQHV